MLFSGRDILLPKKTFRYFYLWEKRIFISGKTGRYGLHENEAAEILRQICQGEHMHPSGSEGRKIELIADCEGIEDQYRKAECRKFCGGGCSF